MSKNVNSCCDLMPPDQRWDSPQHCRKSISLLWHSHSKTREQPLPLMLGSDVYVACVHHVVATKINFLRCFFPQLAQRFRATVSRFDYSQLYQDRDGCFQINILGLLVCSPQSVDFQKWANSTVNASQPQIKISDFRNFCSAQSNKIRSPFGVALTQRTQGTRSCQHESAWPSLARWGFLQPAPVRENHRQIAHRTEGSTTCRNTGGDSSNSVYVQCLLQIYGTIWFPAFAPLEWC